MDVLPPKLNRLFREKAQAALIPFARTFPSRAASCLSRGRRTEAEPFLLPLTTPPPQATARRPRPPTPSAAGIPTPSPAWQRRKASAARPNWLLLRARPPLLRPRPTALLLALALSAPSAWLSAAGNVLGRAGMPGAPPFLVRRLVRLVRTQWPAACL